MPGGERDSSKTRVVPVFNELRTRNDDWLRMLLSLPKGGSGCAVSADLDLKFVRGYWGAEERGLLPPVSLLSWLIRNISPPLDHAMIAGERAQLLERNPATIEQALTLLKTNNTGRGWWIFEGRSYPDVLVETEGAIIVVEGKRTESGPTTCTRWMSCRHQMWRHMDAAWEVRGRREVFGLFIVEGTSPSSAEMPAKWREAAADTLRPTTWLAVSRTVHLTSGRPFAGASSGSRRGRRYARTSESITCHCQTQSQGSAPNHGLQPTAAGIGGTIRASSRRG